MTDDGVVVRAVRIGTYTSSSLQHQLGTLLPSLPVPRTSFKHPIGKVLKMSWAALGLDPFSATIQGPGRHGTPVKG